MKNAQVWHNTLVKFVLFFFGIALWSKWLSLNVGILVTSLWILDNGLRRLGQVIKEPFVLAILIFCAVLALGILWGDFPESGRLKWRRYFGFLIFVPFLSLLNKDRLPWAISGLLAGYFSVLLIGIYQWAIVGVQGIPLLDISYLTFSSMLGIGVILSLYFAGVSTGKKIKSALWFLATFLFFMQLNQNGRGPLLATLLASVFLIYLRYKAEKKALLSIVASATIMVVFFAHNDGNLHERLVQAQADIELSKQGKYDNSLGYRLAVWDVGLHGIAQKPLFGHGTGVPESYFEKTVVTYKDGRYKDLPKFLETSHYHNDWIEIGMHIGALGILAFSFLLWSWYQTLKTYQLPLLGAALVCFIFISGLTDTFALFSKIPTLLLVITAIGIGLQKENRGMKQ
ncbi:O-antigen ligase [Nitrosospira sp. Nsp18]|uniref:O-antigen ligase family protein n=1 Tax=Nitrosospira sp. Nsp18 TaxID=1855334 RepID=UPI00087E4FCB|nr:O-antigen ligase family protein [Nitrosospira sp. Nsp18]SDA24594.1 O-antigen ligase [Nitrosospira sp. Nsp18]